MFPLYFLVKSKTVQSVAKYNENIIYENMVELLPRSQGKLYFVFDIAQCCKPINKFPLNIDVNIPVYNIVNINTSTRGSNVVSLPRV